MTDARILANIKDGDTEAVREVYLTLREPFLAFAQRYHIGDETAVDIYHDTFIALHENIVRGKINDLSSSLKTYMFSIGKYKIYSHLRQHQKMAVGVDEERSLDLPDLIDVDSDSEVLTERQTAIKKALKKLGDRCRNILELFYYRGFKIDEIRVKENYQNNNTVKSQKSRCLKKLKELVLKE